MPKFPVDAPKTKVIRAFEILGFRVVREREHIAMRLDSGSEVRTLALLNHSRIKSSTLHRVCTQAGISREDFVRAYHRT